MSILTNNLMTMMRTCLADQRYNQILFVLLSLVMLACKPDEDIELRRIKDVVVDASTDPVLKANAVFFNPNNMRGRLKKIKVEIFVNGKKAGDVDQDLKMKIPAKSEFTVPLEVKLALKEIGVLNTLLGMIGGKKLEVQYKGYLRLSYKGIPIKVPVDYKDDVKMRF